MKALQSVIFCTLMSIVPLIGQTSNPSKFRTVLELFQVSNIGVPNAAEQTDKLIELFDSIKLQYKAEMEEQGISGLKGDRVRIIRILNKSEPTSPLYMIAYGGGPSVAKIESSKPFKPGELTPPLIIAANGEHVTKYTRRVPIQSKGKRQLQQVNKSSGASFFGIPIGGGNSSGQNVEEVETTYKNVTETKTLRKYTAKISTEKIDSRPTEMTKEMFLSRLKNGEVFEVTQHESRRCLECNGWRRIIPMARGIKTDKDGKISCPDCKEAGKLDWKVIYQVTW